MNFICIILGSRYLLKTLQHHNKEKIKPRSLKNPTRVSDSYKPKKKDFINSTQSSFKGNVTARNRISRKIHINMVIVRIS